MSLQQKMRKLQLTPLPKPKWPEAVHVPLDNDNVPDEFKMLVSEGNLESIVYYASSYGMQANYKVTYKKDDKDSRYTTYEFFWIERETNKKAI